MKVSVTKMLLSDSKDSSQDGLDPRTETWPNIITGHQFLFQSLFRPQGSSVFVSCQTAAAQTGFQWQTRKHWKQQQQHLSGGRNWTDLSASIWFSVLSVWTNHQTGFSGLTHLWVLWSSRRHRTAVTSGTSICQETWIFVRYNRFTIQIERNPEYLFKSFRSRTYPSAVGELSSSREARHLDLPSSPSSSAAPPRWTTWQTKPTHLRTDSFCTAGEDRFHWIDFTSLQKLVFFIRPETLLLL